MRSKVEVGSTRRAITYGAAEMLANALMRAAWCNEAVECLSCRTMAIARGRRTAARLSTSSRVPIAARDKFAEERYAAISDRPWNVAPATSAARASTLRFSESPHQRQRHAGRRTWISLHAFALRATVS